MNQSVTQPTVDTIGRNEDAEGFIVCPLVSLLGIDIKGRYIVATNGRVVRRSRAGEIRKALHGMTGAKNQKNWWSGRDHGAGYVVIKGD